MTVSAQIALFVSEMRQHLLEEAAMIHQLDAKRGDSFDEGFSLGLAFWRDVLQAEDDFFYALDVLSRMAEPLGALLPDISRPQLDGAVDVLLKEIASREKSLAALQRELLELNPGVAEESFSKEVRDDFRQTFEKSLEELLR